MNSPNQFMTQREASPLDLSISLNKFFGKRGLMLKINDTIRYANCWEDTEIVLKALDAKEKGIYLSISSAGDNALGILTKNPNLVLAVDRSPAQIACIEIRKMLFQNLSYDEVLSFIGIKESSKRILTYKKLRKFLSAEVRNFWNNNLPLISKGIIHSGKVENYFHSFKKWIMPLIMSKDKWLELISKKNKSERVDFYNKKIDSWRWNLFINFVFNPTVLKNLDLGRDSYSLNTEGNNISEKVRKRIKYALTTLPTHNNPYLEYIIKGNFQNALPFFLRYENFEKIRQNLVKLKIFKGTLKEALRKNRNIIFDGFYLSDIFEYMTYNQYAEEINQILPQLKKEGRIVYWNNLISRKPPDYLKAGISPLDELSKKLFLKNKAFFYNSLNIFEAKSYKGKTLGL
jgi:S-adenosylmethionine-diacylglycerol 3-amino-3-carboxypropyl transferase